jgi:hypothetical protein
MPIHPDIARIARHYGVDPALIQAVMVAEGGTIEHLLKAVQCSIPSTRTTDEAIGIVCRSAAHAMSDWIKARDAFRAGFVSFWASRWAPVGVANDPTSLNKNWPTNVMKAWTRDDLHT